MFVSNVTKSGNGTCCYDFVWDNVQNKCLPCKHGYYGENCSRKCQYPFYGYACTSQCNCSANDCDYVSGCRQSSTLKLTSISTGKSLSTSTEVGKLVNSGTSYNSSCNHNSKSASPSKKPFLVGIIILASMSFIIILLTLYTYRLEMNQQSTTKQKENI